MRLRKIPGIEKEFIHYPNLIIDNDAREKISWGKHFNNDHDLYLEVGMGRGRFIDAMSKANPDANFVAMEIKAEVVYDAALKIGDDRSNLAIIRDDAALLCEWFGKGEVKGIFLNFSDPWPKTRHGKRRLTHENFLKLYREILAPDGEVFFRTDVQSLMEFTLAEMTNHGFALEEVSLDFHNSRYFDGITTEYEEKKSKHGCIYYARFCLKK